MKGNYYKSDYDNGEYTDLKRRYKEHCRSVSERIKLLREEKKISLQQLADLTNISKSALQRYEKGADIPTTKLQNIAKALDTTTSWLLFEQPEKPAKEELLTWDLTKFKDYIFNIAMNDAKKKEQILAIVEHLNKLNETGLEEALKRTEELTMIPNYIDKLPQIPK